MSMKIGPNVTTIPNGATNTSGISAKAKQMAQIQDASKDEIQKPAEKKTGENSVSRLKNAAKQSDDLKNSAKPSVPQQTQPIPTATNAASAVYNYNKVATKVPIQAAGSAIDIFAK